jgi:hypothetical protein
MQSITKIFIKNLQAQCKHYRKMYQDPRPFKEYYYVLMARTSIVAQQNGLNIMNPAEEDRALQIAAKAIAAERGK